MAKAKKSSVNRFGARYGRGNKDKLAQIEKEQKKKHICPYCKNPKVKRVSVGIWQCSKCNAKFTNKAYTVAKLKEETVMSTSSAARLEQELKKIDEMIAKEATEEEQEAE